MEIYYKGHVIRVCVVRIPQTGCWTIWSWVIWNSANGGGTKTLLHHSLDLANSHQAMQAGIEIAAKWIGERRPRE
jgi:hypothetical protein